MYPTTNLKEKLQQFLLIVIPILVTQLSIYAMNFFDTVMSGNAGTADLAGVAIGSSLWMPVFTGLSGILLALSPIVAQLSGSQQKKKIAETVRQGVYLSIALAFGTLIAGYVMLDPILNHMSLTPEVQYIAKYYVIALGSGLIPIFLFNLLRCFLDALGQTKMSMFIILISLPLNILFNYMFIFGKLGAPALGGVGAGIASSLTYWISVFLTIIVIHKVRPFSDYRIFKDWSRPSLPYWKEQLRIGIPVGFAIFFETSIFAAVTLFMSVYDTETIAAHQAAMNFASFLYMIPLSIAMALTIAVGFEVGAGRIKDARTYAYLGISIGVVVAFLAGFILYVFDDPVARLYNDNMEVVNLTKQFIFFAIFYQLADGFGAPLQGILRGYKDVNITLITAFVSYWGVGLPSGWLLANFTDFGPFGYWLGLTTGLSTGALILLIRLIYLQKKTYRVFES